MTYTNKQLASALVDAAFTDNPKNAAESLVAFLSSQGELHRIRNIVDAVENLWRQRYGIATIKIETAHPLSRTARKKISVMSKGAQVIESVDKNLIGGARLRVDDTVVDGSMSEHLTELKHLLQNS